MEAGLEHPEGEAQAIAAAQDRARVDVLNERAWRLHSTDARQGVELAVEARELAVSLGYDPGLAYSLRNAAACHLRLGGYETAIACAATGSEMAGRVGDRYLEASCVNILGSGYQRPGELGASLEHFASALRIWEEIEHPFGRAFTLNNIGAVYNDLCDHERALDCRLQALDIVRGIQAWHGEPVVLSNVGSSYHELGRHEDALRFHQEAISAARREGDRGAEANTMTNLGQTHEALGHPQEALASYAAAIELAREVGDRQREAGALHALGLLHYRLGEHAPASEHLRAALALATQIGSRRTVYLAHRELSELLEATGELALALEHLKRYHEVEREVAGHETDRRVRALTLRLEVERTRQENDLLRRADEEKSALLDQLREQAVQLERQVREDPLTGLANRRSLELGLAREFALARRSGDDLTVALVDIDRFKDINDDFSHAVGDEVLKAVASIFRRSCRSTDLVARYGGEEFVLVLPGAAPELAARVCENLRRAVEAHAWDALRPGLRVTVSVGLCGDPAAESAEQLLGVADARLYGAKSAGRNRVQT